MGVETSSKKTKPSDQSNLVIAIGKRKEESYSRAMSLQDVFSDSANLVGMQQKTISPVRNRTGVNCRNSKKKKGKKQPKNDQSRRQEKITSH